MQKGISNECIYSNSPSSPLENDGSFNRQDTFLEVCIAEDLRFLQDCSKDVSWRSGWGWG